MFCLCLCPRICLCVCFCRFLWNLQMNPDAVLFPVMYDKWVATLKSLECGCLSIIGLQRELTEVILYPLCGGYTWRWWKPRLGRHPMGPTKMLYFNKSSEEQRCWPGGRIRWIRGRRTTGSTKCSPSTGSTGCSPVSSPRWPQRSLIGDHCQRCSIKVASTSLHKHLVDAAPPHLKIQLLPLSRGEQVLYG